MVTIDFLAPSACQPFKSPVVSFPLCAFHKLIQKTTVCVFNCCCYCRCDNTRIIKARSFMKKESFVGLWRHWKASAFYKTKSTIRHQQTARVCVRVRRVKFVAFASVPTVPDCWSSRPITTPVHIQWQKQTHNALSIFTCGPSPNRTPPSVSSVCVAFPFFSDQTNCCQLVVVLVVVAVVSIAERDQLTQADKNDVVSNQHWTRSFCQLV